MNEEMRIAWFIVNSEYLCKRPWGRSFIDWQRDGRRGWKERRALRRA